MVVAVLPVGVRCNLSCSYCYEEPLRNAGNYGTLFEIEKVKQAVVAEGGGPFLTFGGEPLLLPKDKLEQLWAWGLKLYGRNSIQTNGSLIDEDHIRLFQEYKVLVGISIDGPAALNDARRRGTLAETRAATSRSEFAIRRLCELGAPPGLIVILHRQNAVPAALPELFDWFRDLKGIGVRGIGIHLLEVEDEETRLRYALTDDENIHALRMLLQLRDELQVVRFKLFDDIENLLMGQDSEVNCVWTGCDPGTTPAVRGVGGHGERSLCGRVNKEGVDYIRVPAVGYERYIALSRTSQSDGGCRGCRFFLMCKGQCPGTAIDGDWRNRSEQCAIWKQIFADCEARLKSKGKDPLSRSPLLSDVTRSAVAEWMAGRSPSIAREVTRHEALNSGRWLPSVDARGVQHVAAENNPPQRRFERLSWTSADARDTWLERLDRITSASNRIAYLSVVAGTRPCAIVDLDPPEHEEALRLLRLEPVSIHVLTGAGPPADPTVPHPQAARERLLIVRKRHAEAALDAWARGDATALGDLLGYPTCCVRFFSDVLSSGARTDPVWEASQGQEGEAECVVALSGKAVSANPLLRRLNVLGSPHVPCGFSCAGTNRLYEALAQLGVEAKLGAELDWLHTLLSFSADWSSLHGISEVKTPIFKLWYSGDYSSTHRSVRLLGITSDAMTVRGVLRPAEPAPQRVFLGMPLLPSP